METSIRPAVFKAELITRAPSRRKAEQLNNKAKQVSPLVFVNYSKNPSKESKEKRHRSVIAKWAVINGLRYPNGVIPTDSTRTTSKAKSDLAEVEVELDIDRVEHDGHAERDDSNHLLTPISHGSPVSRSPSPLAILSQACEDPFNSLPGDKPSLITWRLLTNWLDASEGFDTMKHRNQVSRLRKGVCFPYLLNSSVAFNAAVALMGVNTMREMDKNAVEYQLQLALPQLHSALALDDESQLPDTALAIILLMIVAARTNQSKALQSHFLGLSALLARYPELITEHIYILSIVHSWGSSYSGATVIRELPPFLRLQGTFWPTNEMTSTGQGLLRLYEQDLIHRELLDSVLIVLRLQHLSQILEARKGTTEDAANYLRCSWATPMRFMEHAKRFRRLHENSIRFGATLVFILEITRQETRGIQNLCTTIANYLSTPDIDELLEKSPEMVLWLILLAGPFGTKSTRDTLHRILPRVRTRLNVYTIEEAIQISSAFIWTEQHTARLPQFWMETSEDTAEFTPSDLSHESQYSPWSLSSNEAFESRCAFCDRERCPCLARRGAESRCPEYMRGMLWVYCVAGFQRMCEIEQFHENY